MNTDVMEDRSKATEDLINQIESCLAERLLQRRLSDIHYPLSALNTQISRPSSNRLSLSSTTSEDSHNRKVVSPAYLQESSQLGTDKSFKTSNSGNNGNQASEGNSRCEPDSSTDFELSPYLCTAIDMQPGVNWRLKPQIRSKDGMSSSHIKSRRTPLSTNQLETLNVDENLAKSNPSSYSNKEKAFALWPLDETEGTKSEKKALQSKLRDPPDVKNAESSSKEINGDKVDRKQSTRGNAFDQECPTLVKNRGYKIPGGLSERQLNGHKALQRRLKYDPRASVAKERFKSKEMDNQGHSIDPKGPRNESTEFLRNRPARRLPSVDSRSVQSRTSKQDSNASNGSSKPQSLDHQLQNPRSVGTAGKDTHKRITTNSLFGRIRSEQRGTKPKSTLSLNDKSNNPDSVVEIISQKLERLATHVVRLRKLVERDYSETGYCSAGDDIYVDEEVGAMSNGKPTGMHPSIASSLRSIRLLEANVQEIFDLLYANEAQIWCPVGLRIE